MRSLKNKISRLKSSAKHRKIKVRLMEYEYESLLNLGCHYCGKDVLSENGYCLDRIDCRKGYTLHNCVACCKKCNLAKGTMSFKEFVEWIEKAYNHQQKVINRLKSLNYINYSYQKEKQLHKLTKTKNNCKFIGML